MRLVSTYPPPPGKLKLVDEKGYAEAATPVDHVPRESLSSNSTTLFATMIVWHIYISDILLMHGTQYYHLFNINIHCKILNIV